MPEETLTSWGLRWLFWAGVTVTCMIAVAFGVTWMIGMTFFPVYQANTSALVVTGIISSGISAAFYVVTNYQRYLRQKEAFLERKRQEFMHRVISRPVSPEENRRMAEHQTAMVLAQQPPPEISITRNHLETVMVGGLIGAIAATQASERPHPVDITERNLDGAPPTEDLVERIKVKGVAPPGKRDRYEAIKV